MTIAPEQHRTVNDLPNPVPGWRWLAACRVADPDLFIAKRGGGNRKALAYCTACPVLESCLVAAVRHDDRAMIRGAKTARQRDLWLKNQGIARPASASTGGAKSQKPRVGRLLPVDVPRVVELHDRRELTFREIAALLGYTERTIQRRYAAWKRQQQGGEG